MIKKQKEKVTYENKNKYNKMTVRFLSALLILSFVLTSFVSCKKVNNSGDTTEADMSDPTFNLTEDEINVFSNPISLKNAWSGGVGDPFIMRYDGTYYLYPSSAPDPYIKCWSSKNLTNWKYEGAVAEHEDLTAAYAPEVTYFNGKFYMYTATPDGQTHRCLVSDSPTGPFELVGGAQDRLIDGHVFIDNDGKWYFYSGGVFAYEMESPEWIGGSSMGTMAQISGAWTEGPMVVYHDGIYYMTYTGTHVYNKAYRIAYSTSKTSPYKYTASSGNTVLVSTEGKMVTCGHSSTVKAPDLDGYYIAYHTFLSKDSANGRNLKRYVALDRIIFDGTNMSVMGPTENTQVKPSMPDIYSHFDEGDADIFEVLDAKTENGRLIISESKSLISKNSLPGSNYTIEATLYDIAKDGKAGVVFGYSDENNYGKAVFDTKTEKLVVTFVTDGKEETREKELVRSFKMPYDFSALQAIQIEKSGSTFTFYVNDRELCKFESELDGNKVGLITESGASFGYFCASDEVGGSNCEFYKTVSAKSTGFPAYLALEKENLELVKGTDGNKAVKAAEGDSLNYIIYASEGGNHSFGIKYKAAEDAIAEVYLDGKLCGELTLKKSGTYDGAALSGMKMDIEKHVVTLYIKKGNAEIKTVNIVKVAEKSSFTLDFAKSATDKMSHTDGMNWTVSDGFLRGEGIGKRTYGDPTLGDYTHEGTIKFDSDVISGGLLVRTKNASHTGLIDEGESGAGLWSTPTEETTRKGENMMQGYYIQFTKREILLKRCDFDSAIVRAADFKAESGKEYAFKAVCEGASIKFYVDGKLLIDYTDGDAFLSGYVGMRITSGSAVYGDIKVSEME